MSTAGGSIQRLEGDLYNSIAHRLVKEFINCMDEWHFSHRESMNPCNKIFHTIVSTNLSELESHILRLTSILEIMKSHVEQMKLIIKQFEAFMKLQNSTEPLFKTWTCEKFSAEFHDILSMLDSETNLKIYICENIAHCRDENLLEVYRSMWEFNTEVNGSKLQTLRREITLS